MQEPDAAPAALWLVVATGAAAGLLASIVGHALLGLALVRVRVRHVTTVDGAGVARLLSYVSVTNLRGRPVQIEQVFILKRGTRGEPGMSRPKGWDLPKTLTEGQVVRYSFDRVDYPNAVAVSIDSADRVWPRRRWLRVKRRALWSGGVTGWPWQRNGPTKKQMDRLASRIQRVRHPGSTTT